MLKLNKLSFLTAVFFLTGFSESHDRYYRTPPSYNNQIYLRRDPSLCLAVYEKAHSSNLIATTCDENDPRQRWDYDNLFLKNVHSGLCADGSDFNHIKQQPCDPSRKWNAWARHDDTIALLVNNNDHKGSRFSKFCMDVTDAAVLIIYVCEHGNPNQQFGLKGFTDYRTTKENYDQEISDKQAFVNETENIHRSERG